MPMNNTMQRRSQKERGDGFHNLRNNCTDISHINNIYLCTLLLSYLAQPMPTADTLLVQAGFMYKYVIPDNYM